MILLLEGLDVRVWRSSYTSRIATKDLYGLYKGELVRRLDGAWISKLRVHSRISRLIWNVAWNRFPIRALLRAWGMDIPSTYPYCYGLEDETMVHVLFFCLRGGRVCRLVSLLPMTILRERSGQTFWRWCSGIWSSRLWDVLTLGRSILFITFGWPETYVSLRRDRLVLERDLSQAMEIVDALFTLRILNISNGIMTEKNSISNNTF